MKSPFIILIVCLIICIGCDSKEPENIDIPAPPNTNPIELDLKNKEEIRLWCRSIFSFEAIENGEYTIEVENPAIAKASVYGKRFTVKTINPGETDITIKSSHGESSTIKCYSRTFSRYWVESYELEHTLNYKSSLMVVVKDKSVAAKIKEELKPLSSNRGYQYYFSEETDELSLVLGVGNPIKGTYKWEVQTQTLTLDYEGQSERYTCDIQPEYPNFWVNQPRFILATKQDLTRKYALQYPEAGIKDVYIIRHIMALGDWWLTARELN